MQPPILRRAQPRDAATLAALGRDTFLETFVEGFGLPYPPEDLAAFLESSQSPAAFAAKLADPAGAVWIAEADGAALAYAAAGPCALPHPEVAPGHLELSRLYVRGSAQGLGLGRRLLETALDWMATHSRGPAWLGVWSGNLKAQRLYEAYGFGRVGEYLFPVGRWEDLDYVYRRDRPPA